MGQCGFFVSEILNAHPFFYQPKIFQISFSIGKMSSGTSLTSFARTSLIPSFSRIPLPYISSNSLMDGMSFRVALHMLLRWDIAKVLPCNMIVFGVFAHTRMPAGKIFDVAHATTDNCLKRMLPCMSFIRKWESAGRIPFWFKRQDEKKIHQESSRKKIFFLKLFQRKFKENGQAWSPNRIQPPARQAGKFTPDKLGGGK